MLESQPHPVSSRQHQPHKKQNRKLEDYKREIQKSFISPNDTSLFMSRSCFKMITCVAGNKPDNLKKQTVVRSLDKRSCHCGTLYCLPLLQNNVSTLVVDNNKYWNNTWKHVKRWNIFLCENSFYLENIHRWESIKYFTNRHASKVLELLKRFCSISRLWKLQVKFSIQIFWHHWAYNIMKMLLTRL